MSDWWRGAREQLQREPSSGRERDALLLLRLQRALARAPRCCWWWSATAHCIEAECLGWLSRDAQLSGAGLLHPPTVLLMQRLGTESPWSTLVVLRVCLSATSKGWQGSLTLWVATLWEVGTKLAGDVPCSVRQQQDKVPSPSSSHHCSAAHQLFTTCSPLTNVQKIIWEERTSGSGTEGVPRDPPAHRVPPSFLFPPWLLAQGQDPLHPTLGQEDEVS